MEIYENRLYIADKATVFIYSLDDLALLKKFGQMGEGPKEFKLLPFGDEGLQIHPENGYLYITSVGKLSIFTKDGIFKAENKTIPNFFGDLYKPVQGNFIGLGTAIEKNGHYVTVNIYNSQLKKIHELCKWPTPAQQGKGTRVYSQPYLIHSYDKKIFISGTPDFIIDVFNLKGVKIYTIQKDYQKIRISENRKKQVLRWLETGPEYKHIYPFMKPILFPDHYPAIRDFRLADKNIYILTYKRNEDEHKELCIMNIKGKILTKTFVPLKDKHAFSLYPYTIYKDLLYQLIENDESEEWELTRFPLNI